MKFRVVCVIALAAWAILSAQNAAPPIHFAYQPIDFRLDSSETPRRHAPETMAGGVAVFDYNNDGHLDIFFTNGADIESLKKTSPKYSDRLFENDGKGHFTDVTAKVGLAGSGFDNAVAVGDYDNDGREDLFVGGVHGLHLYHNNGGVFTDVTAKAGLSAQDPEYGPLWSVGAAWVDVNNDGLLDLFIVNYLAWDPATEPKCEASPGTLDYCHPKYYGPTPNQLYLNNGDGTFRDVSASSGIRAHPGKGMSIAPADYDLDGLVDLFIPNDKMVNFLFHNQGGGEREGAGQRQGAGQRAGSGQGEGVGERQGVERRQSAGDRQSGGDPQSGRERQNAGQGERGGERQSAGQGAGAAERQSAGDRQSGGEGQGTEQQQSAGQGEGVGERQASGQREGTEQRQSATGRQGTEQRQRAGQGEGAGARQGAARFEEVAFQAGVALGESGKFISGMGADFRDVDNDGLPDIVFAALDNETFPLFRNLGKRGFDDITQSSGMARLTLPMAGYSPVIADFDNDGWKDIFVTRGHVQATGTGGVKVDQPNTVFRNLGVAKPGGVKFAALTEEAGLTAQPPARHRGSAVGDLNGDGRLDVVTTALGAPAEIWMNDSPSSSHWLELKLEGVSSNRDGIGARIKVTAGPLVQYSQVFFAAGYASSSAGPTHFGLGPARSADSVEIRWPSGIVQELKNVPADQMVHVKEPAK